MRRAVLLLAVLAVFGVAGCGDRLDAESSETDARQGFEAAGVTVEDVSCPSEGETGETIECDVTLEGGEEVKLPYEVNEETVDATDETIEVITRIAQEQQEK